MVKCINPHCGKDLTDEEISTNFCECGEPIQQDQENEDSEVIDQISGPNFKNHDDEEEHDDQQEGMKDEYIRCPHCKYAENPLTSQQCKKCGEELQEPLIPKGDPISDETKPIETLVEDDSIRCLKCGFIIGSEFSFCPKCGSPVENIAVCSNCNKKTPSPNLPFCPFCGTQMINLIARPASPDMKKKGYLLFPDDEKHEIESELLIGRSSFENCMRKDIITRHQFDYISRIGDGKCHLRLVNDKGVFYIEDAGSINGTALNGKDITAQGKRKLHDSDVIILAGEDAIKLRFHLSD